MYSHGPKKRDNSLFFIVFCLKSVDRLITINFVVSDVQASGSRSLCVKLFALSHTASLSADTHNRLDSEPQ